MFMNPMNQCVSYEGLLREIKSKNKQIRFLEDKIILIQNQKQTKIKDIETKFSYQISMYKQTQAVLQKQNILLRKRHQQRQLAHTNLQQSYKQLANQIKVLTQANTVANKHTKSMKKKYMQQGREINLAQQQNTQLKSLITVLQKQLKQLTCKNIKLIEENNFLLSTYQDYDRIKYELQQIRSMNEEQYRRQVDIVKSKLKQEMEYNTKVLVEKELTRGKEREVESAEMTVPMINKGLLHQDSYDNHIEQQNNNSHILHNDLLLEQQHQQQSSNQSKHQQTANHRNASLSVNTYSHEPIIGNETINLKVKSFDSIQSPQYRSNSPVLYKEQCQQCMFEKTWSEDVMRLRHFVSYGEEYLRAIINSKKRQNNNQTQHDQQQQDKANNDNQAQSFPAYSTNPNLSSFNHPQCSSILSFILELIQSKQTLYQQFRSQSSLMGQLKSQFTEKTESLLQKINSLTVQYAQKDNLLQTIQQNHELQIQEIQQQRMKQLQQWNQIKTKLNNMQGIYQHFQLTLSTIVKLFAFMLNKYILQSNKLTFYFRQSKYFSPYPNLFADHKNNSGENNHLYSNTTQTQRNIPLMTINQQNSRKQLKIKLKKALFTVLFIVTLKRTAAKLRRRTLLTLGIKTKNKINPLILTNQNCQENTIINNNISTDQLYTISTFELISQNYSIPKQIKIQYEWSSNHIATISSTQKVHQILQRCLYDNVRDQIMASKLTKSKNLEIEKYFNNLESGESLNEQKFIDEQVMKIIFQEMFLQKFL